MKVNIELDVEPEEIRRLVGLPDITPVNDALIARIQNRVENGFDAEDLDKLVRLWIGGASAGVGEIQKTFWNVIKSAGTRATGGRKADAEE